MGTIVGARGHHVRRIRPAARASRAGRRRRMHMCCVWLDTRRNIPTMERLWCSSRRHLPWPAACTHACVVRSGARGLCKHATRAANNSPDWALEHGTQRARSPYVPIAPAGLYSSQHDPCHVVFLSRQDQPVHGRIRGRRQRCTCTHPITFIQFIELVGRGNCHVIFM